MPRKNSKFIYFLYTVLVISNSISPLFFASEIHENPFYIALDASTSDILTENSSHHLWHPASLTKLMTAYVVFSFLEEEKVTLKKPIVISKKASKYPPANSTFGYGTIITLDDALKLILVKSANDIAVSIAESLCKTEGKFVTHMNATAKKLGMASTHFMNAHGLIQHGHYTTANDMAILTLRIKRDFPKYAHYFNIEGLEIQGKKFFSTNWLIGSPFGITGMKTGFTCASGFNYVASATKNKKDLIVVVLGAVSRDLRNNLSENLLFNGFSQKNKPNPIKTTFHKKNLSENVPDISDIVCTAENESGNYTALLKEQKDRKEETTNFEVIIPLNNTRKPIKKKEPLQPLPSEEPPLLSR
ncbi:D-alanyl-D-alanine carboxypeptidase family protein [Candidatus Liberibacter sp.]|uniref:D-alanyl-D-alanine carboxypeptidase family protein n=1 Tax=Candidatus Liberibacter sp. TaxID=34022 RepID=UPI0015F41168|nr:D-alanyl-D-alanine carboxypeptidase family protein [Candidatus Liberibacter sp.]MBA5724093.1 D-alanyl-D-alanine carboxypeptidase [Candidatus Liberibacter sp.]